MIGIPSIGSVRQLGRVAAVLATCGAIARVDYVAGLGGGVVEIGAGEFLMRDSLHLRSGVTVRGRKGQTILRKADGVISPLALDGDFGEQQITVEDPTGF